MSPVSDRWFGAVTADVALDPAITPTAKAVYMVLACHADREGKCWPGGERIAICLGVNRSTVTRALADLEKHKVVRREPRFVDGRQVSNLYVLLDIKTGRRPD